MEYDLKTLNDEQLAPVLDTEGAILVTAGAGSGKTRLLTHRIAYLINEKGVSPFNILAITFTNKAAREMEERLIDMSDGAQNVWVSTFHAMCARMLRRFSSDIGYTSSFSIYGDAEKEKLIGDIVSEKGDDDLKKKAIHHISNAKNLGLDPQQYLADFSYVNDVELICEVYAEYNKRLKACNAMDFDDLLVNTRELLLGSKEAFEFYTQKFHYIHVDEFQDTNTIQYELIKLLSSKYRNVCVVGDEDQCIYGWRGANIENIRSYIRDFNCKIYKLEQNYRSSKKILGLANKLIANNTSRIEKKLWTNNGEGVNIEYYVANGDSDEADFVVQTICALGNRGYKLSDFAVLMRINALSRPFEQRFMQYGVAHKVYGGFKFYDRKEIKDLLAYFRLTANHYDNEAISRVINFPRRGIGASTLSALTEHAALTQKTLYDTIVNIDSENLSPAVKKKVAPFAAVLKCLDAQKDKLELSELMKYLIAMLDLKTIYSEDTEENVSRKANIGELVTSIKEYTSFNPDATLDDYMQTVTLWSDLDDTPDNDSVSIATVHSAKGLEYKVVFIVGMEDGIFPIARATTRAELEEERRLFYVAITRAKERLYITRTRSRYLYGNVKETVPSRFLKETDLERSFARKNFDEQNYGRERGGSGYGRRENAYSGSRYDDSGYTRDVSYDDYSYKQKTAKSVCDDSGYQRDISYDDEYSFRQKTEYSREGNRPIKRTDDVSGYVVGGKVRHKKFGLGTIESISGSGISLSAVINFEKCGKMNIALAYAPLTRED